MNSLAWIPAGTLMLASVRLSQVVSQWWLLLKFLVSAYLVISGFTGNCPAKNFLRKQLGEAADDDED
jgi:hypothetical protein